MLSWAQAMPSMWVCKMLEVKPFHACPSSGCKIMSKTQEPLACKCHRLDACTWERQILDPSAHGFDLLPHIILHLKVWQALIKASVSHTSQADITFLLNLSACQYMLISYGSFSDAFWQAVLEAHGQRLSNGVINLTDYSSAHAQITLVKLEQIQPAIALVSTRDCSGKSW